jgi:hypothetical protein
MSLAFVVIPDDVGDGGEVVLERRCWSGGGGFVVLLQICQWEATDSMGTSPG